MPFKICLKYYTNTVILGRQAYVETLVYQSSIVAERNISSEYLQRKNSILDKSGVLLSAGGRTE